MMCLLSPRKYKMKLTLKANDRENFGIDLSDVFKNSHFILYRHFLLTDNVGFFENVKWLNTNPLFF